MKLRELPLAQDGSVDERAWITSLAGRGYAGAAIRSQLADALSFSRARFAAFGDERAQRQMRAGFEIADIVSDLQADASTLTAALAFRVVRTGAASIEELEQALGTEVASLCEAVQRMGSVSLARLARPEGDATDESDRQLDGLRRMLVSMIDDPRVPVIKLAERTSALRSVAGAVGPRRERVAREARQIFAPLAERLGISRIRWELEDLAFRCLQEPDYRRMAAMLGSRRADRETEVDRLAGQIASLLVDQIPDVRVEGRAKHLYSIWRKMQNKRVRFDEIHDKRAVRVIVDNTHACYLALGLLHTRLEHLQHELDDYIASPKPNGYQSLHSAVIGPDGDVMEIQIRTAEMHAEAELGVCAHWAYKRPGESDLGESFENKLSWLRELLDNPEEAPTAAQLSQRVVEGFASESVHVLTRDGDVVDLASGATPIDFAYRLHTEVGHRCRGAVVDGRAVPLNTPLISGQHVEVVTGDRDEPPLEWLDRDAGFIATSRARNAVRSWLRALPSDRSRQIGRRWLGDQISMLAGGANPDAELASLLEFANVEALWLAIGRGECSLARVFESLDLLADRAREATQLDLGIGGSAPSNGPERLQVTGVGTMPAFRAPCCEPGEGDSITGWIDGPRVLVHASNCTTLHTHPDVARLVALEWGGPTLDEQIELQITSYDRPGMLRDISGVLADEQVDVTAMDMSRDPSVGQVTFTIGVQVADLSTIARASARLREVRNVVAVQRVEFTGLTSD